MDMRSKRFTDWLNFVLGAWVAASPWTLSDSSAPSNWIMLILGTDMMIVAIWALSEPQTPAPRWWVVVLGSTLSLLPLLCHLDMDVELIEDNLIVGLTVVILTLASMPQRNLAQNPQT
jgi:hypothetical protein